MRRSFRSSQFLFSFSFFLLIHPDWKEQGRSLVEPKELLFCIINNRNYFISHLFPFKSTFFLQKLCPSIRVPFYYTHTHALAIDCRSFRLGSVLSIRSCSSHTLNLINTPRFFLGYNPIPLPVALTHSLAHSSG